MGYAMQAGEETEINMGRKLKKANFWVRRRSAIPVMAIGSLCVLLLFFNEDVSMKLNLEYEQEITSLKQQIKENLDSADYYRARREALEHNAGDLERLAREQYHMQRKGEDVFLLQPYDSEK